MGMYDIVQAVNISHEEFKHNNVFFQTKDLDLELSEYIVFNNQLWKSYDGESSERYPTSQFVDDFSGSLNIYTNETDQVSERWIEYNLEFKDGILIDVSLITDKVTKDLTDISNKRPYKDGHACITINLFKANEDIYNFFHSDLDEHLNSIREALGDNKATIAYHVKTVQDGSLRALTSSPIRMIHSVVQDMSDFEAVDDGKIKTNTPGGHNLTIILDEAHPLNKCAKRSWE